MVGLLSGILNWSEGNFKLLCCQIVFVGGIKDEHSLKNYDFRRIQHLNEIGFTPKFVEVDVIIVLGFVKCR